MNASFSNKLCTGITLCIHGKALKNGVWNILLAYKLPLLVCFKTKKSICGSFFSSYIPLFLSTLKTLEIL